MNDVKAWLLAFIVILLSMGCEKVSFDAQNYVPNDLVNPIDVATGDNHACAITDEGVRCWAIGYRERLVTTELALTSPTEVQALANSTCAIDQDHVSCWGVIYVGQTDALTGLVNPRGLSFGGSHFCVITDAGLHCWGENDSGEGAVPSGLVAPIAVAAGSSQTCVIDEDTVRCWGANNAPVAIVYSPTEIAVNGENFCVVADLAVYCWGTGDSNGPLGVPIDLVNPSGITVGNNFACALTDRRLGY